MTDGECLLCLYTQFRLIIPPTLHTVSINTLLFRKDNRTKSVNLQKKKKAKPFENRADLDRQVHSLLSYRYNTCGSFDDTVSTSNYFQHQILALIMNNYKEPASCRGFILINPERLSCSKLRNPVTTVPLCFNTSQSAVCVKCVGLLCMVVLKWPIVTVLCQ